MTLGLAAQETAVPRRPGAGHYGVRQMCRYRSVSPVSSAAGWMRQCCRVPRPVAMGLASLAVLIGACSVRSNSYPADAAACTAKTDDLTLFRLAAVAHDHRLVQSGRAGLVSLASHRLDETSAAHSAITARCADLKLEPAGSTAQP